MALEIEKNNNSVLKIAGTTIELNLIYARINFTFDRNGADSYGKLYLYNSKSLFESNPNDLLVLDDFSTQHTFTIDTNVEEQSLETGHQKLKEWLENLGYIVTIVDLN